MGHDRAADLKALADVDPDSILDRLNDSIIKRMPTYRDLYNRWERLNWRVADLDFSADVDDWAALDPAHKERLLWTLGSFFVAEQRVAATLTPYVQAAPLPEQRIFLATQCVDESRHSIFFDRFFTEVIAAGEDGLQQRLDTSRRWVGLGFAPLFDEYLVGITEDLREHPDDLRRFAKAVAVYHIVIEGVFALSGQKFILEWARNEGILPGFRAGFTAVARDESRHVQFGVLLIRDLLADDPSLLNPVNEGIAETIRLGTWLYQPPHGDVTYTRAFGYSLADLFNYGGTQLEKKIRAIGIPNPIVDVWVPPTDGEWPPPGGGLIPNDLRSKISATALRTFGRLAPRAAAGVSVMMLHLAFMPEAASNEDVVYELRLAGPGGGTFTVDIMDGECTITIGPGRRAPDAIYEMDAATWLAMAEGRVTGDEAVILGRLRIKGDVVAGRRFNDFFAPVGDPPLHVAPVTRSRSPLVIGSRLARRVLGRDRAA